MSVRRAHQFCLPKLEGYSNKDAVKTDIVATLHNFTDLRPSRDVFQSNGQSRDMVNLKGTIPVLYKGTTYNIPICLYLDRQHPHQPPICLVKPTDAMSVRVGDHVDEDGRVTLPYQREWSHPNSDIVTFIQMMQIHFGEVCPVFTRSKSVSRNAVGFCRTNLENYPNKDSVKSDLDKTLKHFTDLRLSRAAFVCDGGNRTMVRVSGTIPVLHRGSTYNVPICLYLDRQHPHQPPICLVKPTDAMSVRVGDHVDEDGRVTLPYQREWSHPNSDIVTFIQMMQIHFGEVCPVFTRSKSVSRNAVAFCRTNLENYPNKDSVKSDLDKTLKRFTDLRLSRAAFVCDGGNRIMVRVSGTIPVLHRGSTYNVPICMFVEHEHPQLPPISFVQPTANMVVHAGRCVDATGRINLPYQQSWRNSSSRQSDIVGLVEAMHQQFSAEPPVYTIPAAAAGGVSECLEMK